MESFLIVLFLLRKDHLPGCMCLQGKIDWNPMEANVNTISPSSNPSKIWFLIFTGGPQTVSGSSSVSAKERAAGGSITHLPTSCSQIRAQAHKYSGAYSQELIIQGGE